MKRLCEREGQPDAINGGTDDDERDHDDDRDHRALAREPVRKHVVARPSPAAGRGSTEGRHGCDVLSGEPNGCTDRHDPLAGPARFGGLPRGETLMGNKRLPAGATQGTPGSTYPEPGVASSAATSGWRIQGCERSRSTASMAPPGFDWSMWRSLSAPRAW